MPDANVLITGSDDGFVTFIAENLTADGYTVRVATTARAASIALSHPPLEAVLLSDFDERHSALVLLRGLRAGELEHLPVDRHLPAMVAGRADELAALRAFEAGGDDVVSREGSYPLPLARLEALIVRTRRSTALAALARIEGLEIDAGAGEVRYRGRSVQLTPLQHALLCHLARWPAARLTSSHRWRSRCRCSAPANGRRSEPGALTATRGPPVQGGP